MLSNKKILLKKERERRKKNPEEALEEHMPNIVKYQWASLINVNIGCL